MTRSILARWLNSLARSAVRVMDSNGLRILFFKIYYLLNYMIKKIDTCKIEYKSNVFVFI